MPATPQPELSSWGGQQERKLLSMGLFQPPAPLPLLLCPGKPRKTSCSSEPPWSLWEGVFQRHKDMHRVQAHRTAQGAGAAWHYIPGGSVPWPLSTKFLSFSLFEILPHSC